ncbi:hypothetical protein L3X38_017472 [Prunus dulcis]|uniref:Uncharacterized protein n=1 Tax=Prunus dulcis TaxID=3755 RepID=A0AAD4W7V9_PRUDU|nr:hypothetical protein L3X38_017472 [Prunus dulcis]
MITQHGPEEAIDLELRKGRKFHDSGMLTTSKDITHKASSYWLSPLVKHVFAPKPHPPVDIGHKASSGTMDHNPHPRGDVGHNNRPYKPLPLNYAFRDVGHKAPSRTITHKLHPLGGAGCKNRPYSPLPLNRVLQKM